MCRDYIGLRESIACFQKSGAVIMGKTKKFSKGHSSGFVPDYRHAVETMAESEGFGSSGRVDLSEDYAAKRKCISLNVDTYDWFGVPLQVLSLSKMSHSERKNLELRLKSELEQVRLLQKKIASFDSNCMVLSPSSDIHSYSDGQKRLPVEGFQRTVGLSALRGRKRGPPGRNGPRTKPPVGRFELVRKSGPPSTSNATLMKQCETLLDKLLTHDYSWAFNTPVDIVKMKIPDYFSVIKSPMDLGTVKSKLSSGEYSSPLDFAADVKLTFSNAVIYNPSGNLFHDMALTLRKLFEAKWKLIEKQVPVIIDAVVPSTSSLEIENETPNLMPPSKKKKSLTVGNKVKQKSAKRVMSVIEKHRLSAELEALLADLPDNIIEFLKKHSFNASQPDVDEIEIDVDDLSDDTLFALRKLLDDYLLEKQQKDRKAEPCEMELLNESGFSTSTVQPCKGSDPADEDVDIGGNDPPISSYPPVEIEKDTALRSSKCSSSSSSSSESGSSSSDSDSGSSSDTGIKGARNLIPAISGKENSGSNVEQKSNDHVDPDISIHLVNGLKQDEQDSQPKEVAIEAEGHQEGESAPPGRQVSPDKLHRAALLRSRFADTILKAQEKTLDKGEKQDPEKLRLDREELERRRKEEKARLQAEAKAAEESRRKAEAEAAAEARRKRELEREAARQALQKMEKTVDINENCRFMEDLEMLGVAPTEHLQIVEDPSPDHSQDVLGSFKLEGNSNPLEQLGLYMKEDDDEEEEVEPQNVPDAVNDAEEGEID